ncbi:MAG: hypothetical protein SGCHY_004656 [Lobulomycetales sp.]
MIITVALVAVVAVLAALLLPHALVYYTALEIQGKLYPLTLNRASVCRTVQEAGPLGACEELLVHEPSAQVFFICEPDFRERAKWFPHMDRFDPTAKPGGRISVFHAKTNKVRHLVFTDESGAVDERFRNLSPHGGSLIEEDPSTLIFAVVNHPVSKDSRIELFRHVISSDSLQHMETIVDHVLLPRPNSVALVKSEESDDGSKVVSFYATNSQTGQSVLSRKIEKYLRRQTGQVVFWDGESRKMRVVASDIRYANGITTSYGGDTVYVASTTTPGVLVYEVKSHGRKLRLRELLETTPLLPDNISLEPISGNILVTGPIGPLEISKYQLDPATKRQPGMVMRFSNTSSEERFLGRQYEKKIELRDDGSVINFPTSAVVLGNKLFVGGVLEKDVIVCDIGI